MLKFNEEEFVAQTVSAVELREQTEALVADIHKRGIKNLFLIGSGGSYAVMLPYEQLMNHYSTFPTRAAIASELVLSGGPSFGSDSLAIFASASGTTEDVLKAITFAKERGAYTVALTGEAESPVANAVDLVLLSAAHSYDIQMLLITTRLLQDRGEFAGYENFADELKNIPSILVDVAEQADPVADKFAVEHKDMDYLFLIGGGNLWGFTYLYSMCVLEECQWLHTTRVHAAEFFHGSLELVEKDTSVLLFVGEDETRPLMDRVTNFVHRYSDDVSIFDTADYPLKGISPEFRGILSPLIIDTIGGRISKHLEKQRNHDLSLRRYYRVVEY